MKGLIQPRIYLCILFWVFIDGISGTPYQNYSSLHTALFTGYNINLRPVNNDSLPVNVTVDFVLLSIEGLSERDQSLTTNGWLLMEWNDEILTWDAEFFGVPFFTLQQKSIWKPDVAIKNTVKQRRQMGFDDQPVSVFSTGRVVWAPGDIFTTSCDLSVTYYPFDVQTCSIVVYLWISKDTDIRLVPAEKQISLDFFSQNGLWEILSTHTSSATVNGFTEVEFAMKLRRRRLFYVVNIIIPIVFLSCLAPLVFALPAESGEKMGFSITVLLAYTVFLTILGNSIPQTSIQTAILSVYLTAMVIISAASVVLSTLVLKIHSKPEETTPSPKLQKVTRGLRRILCMGTICRSRAVTATTEKEGKMAEKMKSPLTSDTADVTWQTVAGTLDAFLFVLFVFLTLVITLPSLVSMAIKSEV